MLAMFKDSEWQENATNQEIQAALHDLFNKSPQGPSRRQDQLDPQGRLVLKYPQDTDSDEVTSPQGKTTHAAIISSTAISKIQLDWELKNLLSSALRQEAPYSQILSELEGGSRQKILNDLIFKIVNSLLMVHDQKQDASLDFWRIVVPDDEKIKGHIAEELHSTPYSAHPGIQRSIGRSRKSFYWKGILVDVRQFVENCPVCQMEKSDHQLVKGKLTSTQIPEEKWKEISIDFVTELPMSVGNKDTVLTIVDKATRMVHLVPYHKNITVVATAKLLWLNVVKLHSISRAVYSDRRPQFTANSWRELWRLTGTKLNYFSAYHPPNSGCGRANECGSGPGT